MVAHNQKAFGYFLWFLSALFLFYKYAIEVSPSVMTSDIMRDFHVDAAELGNIAASYYYSYLILQIPAGILVDRFGPRKITSIAILLCAMGSIIFSITDSFLMASFARFLNGFGAAFAAINCLKITSNWFPRERFALLAGLMMTIGMLGAVGGQAPLAYFINSVGWRAALNIIGWIGLGLALVFYIFIRDHPRATREQMIMPKQLNIAKELPYIFKRKQPWLLSVYSGLAFAPVSVFGGLWGVPFLMEFRGISHLTAAHYISYVFIGFAIGAPLFGYLSDYFRRRKVFLTLSTLVAFLMIVSILFVPIQNEFLYISLIFVFGFSISGFLLSFTMIREIAPPILAATAIGFMNTFDAFVGAFSDPLTGKILDVFWQGKLVDGVRIFSVNAYRISLSTLPMFLLVAFALSFFIKDTYCNETYPSSLP